MRDKAKGKIVKILLLFFNYSIIQWNYRQ